MLQTVRFFLLGEGLSFLVASLIHRGLLLPGYAHQGATTPETIIATVLLAGFAMTWALPTQVRLIGLIAQAFAILGTTIGLLVVAIGIGPNTPLDVVYHLTIYAVLIWGLVVAWRAPGEPRTATA